MRKLIFMMVLASSVAMPALAQDNGVVRISKEERRAAVRAERAERPQRIERAERPQRVERAQPPQVADRANWSERGEQRQRAVEQQGVRRQVIVRDNGVRRIDRNRRDAPPVIVQQQVFQQRTSDGYGGSQGGSVGDQIRNQWGSQPGVTVVPRDGNRDRYTDRDRNRDRYSDRHWSGQWRHDRNYDWRHYRDRNRSIFRQGHYWDPYGSSYRRFSIGFNLFPSYYHSNYWLDDPFMYRLPPVYGPYRWIRYYDDALLVNIYSGQVVDVVHSFFW